MILSLWNPRSDLAHGKAGQKLPVCYPPVETLTLPLYVKTIPTDAIKCTISKTSTQDVPKV